MKLQAPSDKPLLLGAVHANPGVERWYREKLQQLVRAMAASMLLHVSVSYRENDPAIGFASDDDPVAGLRRSLDKWSARWTANLQDASADIARQFAKRSRQATEASMRAKLKAAGFTVSFQASVAMRRAYKAVIAEQVGLIRRIPERFLGDVQTAVWGSVMRGGTMGQLTDQIKRKYGIAWRHAALIARDQNNKAKAIMEEARRTELGISEAIWQHSGGGREPRPTHVAMNGKRYQIKRGMYDSAVKKHVWPGTEINCRCTSRAIIPALDTPSTKAMGGRLSPGPPPRAKAIGGANLRQ